MEREQPFNLDNWLSSSVFPDARCVHRSRARGQVRNHLPGNRLELVIQSRCFENSAEVAEIGLAGTRKRQHQGTQYLLNRVQRFKALIFHIRSLFKKPRV